jgi:hypothetical protein
LSVHSCFGQAKSDETAFYQSREIIIMVLQMANGQIGIVTDDTKKNQRDNFKWCL